MSEEEKEEEKKRGREEERERERKESTDGRAGWMADADDAMQWREGNAEIITVLTVYLPI